jgi:hypothetical protein
MGNLKGIFSMLSGRGEQENRNAHGEQHVDPAHLEHIYLKEGDNAPATIRKLEQYRGRGHDDLIDGYQELLRDQAAGKMDDFAAYMGDMMRRDDERRGRR